MEERALKEIEDLSVCIQLVICWLRKNGYVSFGRSEQFSAARI